MSRSMVVVAVIGLLFLLSAERAHAQADIVIEVQETIAVSDSVQVLPPAAVSVNETITVSDDVQLLSGAVIFVGETITISDLFESRLLWPAIGPVSQ